MSTTKGMVWLFLGLAFFSNILYMAGLAALQVTPYQAMFTNQACRSVSNQPISGMESAQCISCLFGAAPCT